MNSDLPIYPYRGEILDAVADNDVVIIVAETGSGKSTQVPQYLLQAGYNVVATQPRRMACVALCDRVGEEIGDALLVGYETAFESANLDTARILFQTDGLLLARGMRIPKDTVLILDEIHEWNLNMETLVALLRKRAQSDDRMKVIIMSATLDAGNLLNFLGEVGSAAVIEIPGRQFPVSHTNFPEESYCRVIADGVFRGKNILAFRPGKGEIFDTIDTLEEIFRQRKLKAEVFALHADMPIERQFECFGDFPHPKVIVSTNVAQTSLTIPGIDMVVDDGLEKRIETENGVEKLVCSEISRADIAQRKGRAGRVRPGEYVLCAKKVKRREFPVPDIGRMLLDHVMLRLYAVGIDPEEIEFYHQPSKEALKEGNEVLTMLGAIKDKRITPLGEKLSRLPVSVRMALMIEKSLEFGITDDILKIAAIIENGGLVRHKIRLPDGRTRFVRYSAFTEEGRSDLLAELDVFNQMADGLIPDPEQSGIGLKAWDRASEIYAKLKELVPCEEYLEERGGKYYEGFLKCLLAGHPDGFMCDGSWACDYNSPRGSYLLSRDSCVGQQRYIIAFPKVISFIDREGYFRSLHIASMSSWIPANGILNFLDLAFIKVSTDFAVSANRKIIIVDKFWHYMDKLPFKFERLQIRKGDPDFDKLFSGALRIDRIKRMRELSKKDGCKRKDFEPDGELNINSHIHYMYRQKDGCLHLYFLNKKEIPAREPIVDEKIIFHFEESKAESVADLRRRILEFGWKKHNKQKMDSLRYMYKITNPLVLAKVLPEINGMTVQLYDDDGALVDMHVGVGFTGSRQGVKIKAYPDLETRSQELSEINEFLCDRWIKSKFTSPNSRSMRKTHRKADFSAACAAYDLFIKKANAMFVGKDPDMYESIMKDIEEIYERTVKQEIKKAVRLEIEARQMAKA